MKRFGFSFPLFNAKGGVNMINAQLKKGLLDVCVLSALSRGESYGYKIIKDLMPYIELSESTLYPILRRLEGSGCVTVHSVEHNGRLRKIYRITDTGEIQIKEFLTDWLEIEKVHQYIEEGIKHE